MCHHCIPRSADAAILLVNSFSNRGVCGVNYFNTIISGNTIGTVRKGCALGYYSFGHEVRNILEVLITNIEAKIIFSSY